MQLFALAVKEQDPRSSPRIRRITSKALQSVAPKILQLDILDLRRRKPCMSEEAASQNVCNERSKLRQSQSVQSHLRHTDITTTLNEYTQSVPESVRKLVNAVADDIMGTNSKPQRMQ